MFFELEPNNPSIGLGASKDARCYTGAVFFGEEAKEFLEFCGGDLAEKGFVIGPRVFIATFILTLRTFF